MLQPVGSTPDRAANGGAPAAGELLRAEGLRKTFASGAGELTVLAGVSLSVQQGELIAVVGASGAGKSTLLHILGALDTPTSGAVYFEGESVSSRSERELAAYRNRLVAFIWQRHHLLPDFTALENVAMPLWVRGDDRAASLQLAAGWLEEVGMAARAGHFAGELSGGEQQRVAIARALAGGPRVLLADEPTGDLDEVNALSVFELMERLLRTHGLTTILATHNLALAQRCQRVFQLQQGILVPAALAAGVGAQSRAESGERHV